MRSLRAAALLALVAGAVAVAPAGAATPPPIAHAAGSDAPMPLPSIVNVRVVRAQSLLEHAAKYMDLGQPDKAVIALNGARSNMTKAWTAAKYVIQTAPPPVAEAGSIRKAKTVRKAKVVSKAKRRTVPVIKARASGAPVGGAYADQYTTAAAVLSLQHAFATTAIGMLDNAAEPLLTSVSKDLFAALNARDAAIAYIHSIAPPPVAGDGSVHAHKSDAVAGWDTTMPNVVPDIDDELQQISGFRATIKLSPGRSRLLDLAELQDRRTQSTLNTYWPPVPAG